MTASEVRQAVKGALAAVPKGATVASYVARIANGGIEVSVNLSPDSVQADPLEGLRHEAVERIRKAANARRP